MPSGQSDPTSGYVSEPAKGASAKQQKQPASGQVNQGDRCSYQLYIRSLIRNQKNAILFLNGSGLGFGNGAGAEKVPDVMTVFAVSLVLDDPEDDAEVEKERGHKKLPGP